MGQLSPEQLRAQRIMDRRVRDSDERDRRRKRRKVELRGKKVINGRVYEEKAICKSKHDALKTEKEIRAETNDLPTAVALSSKGWTVYAMGV